MDRALILIDFQTGFDAPIWGERNNPDAEQVAAKLLKHWRANSAPIFHIRHFSTEPDSPLSGDGCNYRMGLEPRGDEPDIHKSVNSAFIGTDLEQQLRGNNIENLVICGLTTPHCVSTTSRMAANLGFAVELVEDACASFSTNANMDWKAGALAMTPQEIHDTALAHLHGEFVQVVVGKELTGENWNG